MYVPAGFRGSVCKPEHVEIKDVNTSVIFIILLQKYVDFMNEHVNVKICCFYNFILLLFTYIWEDLYQKLLISYSFKGYGMTAPLGTYLPIL